MDLYVIPRKCVEASYELGRIESRLKHEAEAVDNIAGRLRRSGDEKMMIIAKDLSRTNENLKTKIKVLHRMSVALEKAAALYERTENKIGDHEDTGASRVNISYRTVDLKGVLSGIRETFAKL